MTIPLWARWCVFKLTFSDLLWRLRGLPTCPYHGYHAQSWWTGYCKECGEKPSIPPMEDTCSFCGEEKAVTQRANPNGDREIWSLCWECNEYITWSFENSWCMQAEAMGLTGKMVKPFDEWLFDKYQVYSKGDYSQIVIKKKDQFNRLETMRRCRYCKMKLIYNKHLHRWECPSCGETATRKQVGKKFYEGLPPSRRHEDAEDIRKNKNEE